MPLLVIVARSPCPADHDWAQRRPLVAPAFIEKKRRGFDHPLVPPPSVLSSNTSDATRAAKEDAAEMRAKWMASVETAASLETKLRSATEELAKAQLQALVVRHELGPNRRRAVAQ